MRRVSPVWRTLVGLAILGVALVVLLVVGVPLAGVVLIVVCLALLCFTALYNLRIGAARRLLEESAGRTDFEAIATGVLAPAWVWSGTNGGFVAVTPDEVLVSTVTLDPPVIVLREARDRSSVEVWRERWATTALQIMTPEQSVELRTAARMAKGSRRCSPRDPFCRIVAWDEERGPWLLALSQPTSRAGPRRLRAAPRRDWARR
jgi:hypothetical protein